MGDDPVDTLERQMRQLTREVTDLTRQILHEQTMRGYLEDRVKRLVGHLHQKMSRVEVISWCWPLIPLIVSAALLLSLVVSSRMHES
jgi:hypothetical protein